MLMRKPGILLVCVFASASVPALAQPSPTPADVGAQQGAALQAIAARLDKLEKENQDLMAQVRELRQELASTQPSVTTSVATAQSSAAPATPPSPAERLAVQESRTDELAQTKVGSLQRTPTWLTGMILFNAFHNGGFGGTGQYPLTAQPTQSADTSGASFRQTVIGLKFNGPDLPGGGKSSASAYFDFWGGTASPGNNLFRIRTATIDFTWKNTTITAGQDKPIVAPREPTSLAQVGVAPLSAAGNLWDWQPQLRVEQRFVFGRTATATETDAVETGMRAQAGVYETAEAYSAAAPTAYSGTLERQRPGYEGRLMFYRGSQKKRIEIAPGYHYSNTHVAGQSVESELTTLDWLAKPSDRIEFTGAFFHGMNDTGLGALRQGFTILASDLAIPVHATGGWGQFALFPASRFSFHIYGGEESNRASDLIGNSISRNLVYAGNVVYKFASNVLGSVEVSQTRTDYILSGQRLNNHYDLALAYLF
jgi:hypothetical protein